MYLTDIRSACLWIAVAMLAMPNLAAAQAGSTSIDDLPDLTPSELAFMLRQQEKRFEARFEEQAEALAAQQELIDQQRQELSNQANTIQTLQDRFDKTGLSATDGDPADLATQQELAEQRRAQRREMEAQKEAIATQTAAIRQLQTQFDQFSQEQQKVFSETDQQIRARLESLEGSMTRLTTEETTTRYDASEFQGAFQVPGIPAAIRIGGFAKANLVQNVDGFVGEQNRFIVGSIPTRGAQTSDEEANLNVRQSRLNVEYRQNTERGQLRAFVEGDFAGVDSNENDTCSRK